MSSCDPASKTCQSSAGRHAAAPAASCPCTPGKCCCQPPGCPVEAAMEKWKAAFCAAKQEVQIELLKERIRAEWGPVMEKMADATMKAMAAHRDAMLTQALAKKELREEVQDILGSIRD